MIGVNLSAALDVKYSNNQVIEIYFGSTKIWPLTHDYSLDYFTITSLEDANTITFSSYYSSNVENLQYSLDGNTWNSYPSGGIVINTDDKVLLRGTNMSVNTTGQQIVGIGNILASKTINVEGNIMSLIYGELFVNATTIQQYQFASLFKGTSSSNYNKIVSAANLVLPSMTLAPHCYQHMFCDNRLLVEAPELPALTLTESCYDCMFQNTGLTTTPPLPATTLAYCCYGGMFQQCPNLTSAFLPATTLVNNCYQYMFYYSTKLNEITCLAKNPDGTNYSWCIGVSSTGTFYKNKDTDWSGVPSYAGGIPDGWEVKNYTTNFTIKALSNGYVSFSGSGISYSKNDGEWTQYTQSLYLRTDDEVKWKGTLTPEMVGGIGTFNATCRYIAYGNIMSLLYGDNFENQTTLSGKSYAFKHLFINNTYLEEADNLILPATILSEGCYEAMFKGCTSLDKFPVLLATTLAPSCYKEMFKGCTLLDTMPELSATTLTQSCYESMFEGCTSLTSASLPATALVTDCYKELFKNCSSLNNISAKFLTDPAGGTYTSNWVYGVAATGIFKKNPSATWTETGVNGFPTGWTVQDDVDYSKEYLTIESLEDNNTLSWKINGYVSSKTIYWSTDKTNWTSVSSSSSGNTITTLNTGDKIYLKGSNSAYGGGYGTYTYFVSNGKFNIYGNVMSLINNDDFVGKTTFSANFTLYHLFHATKIVDASNLILPATTLRNNCYDSLFVDCTLMTKCPKVLPATTLISYCYSGMFYGCTSLTTAPPLPVTSLADHCYYYMFNGCTSLEIAPELPATTLVNNCYSEMFHGCSSLNYIKALFTTTPGSSYTNNWVNGVAASGTFVKNNSATWNVTGINGIPSGWTVINAS